MISLLWHISLAEIFFFFASGSLINHSPVYCLTNIWISISVIACAIYWSDWIIQIRIKVKRLYTRFILYAEMVPGGAFSCEWTQGCFFTLHNLFQSVFMVQSSAVIKRSNIARFCINNCRNWDIISIRCWIHKRHPMARPLWIFLIKLTAL